MARLTPYLAFNGNCREAMAFYRECLGGELWTQSYGESPMAQGTPPEMHERILHSELSGGGMALMAADAPGGDAPGAAGRVTLCLNSEDKEEMRGYFARLSAGATITQPLSDEFFGLFGGLTDRYGINWMFQAGSNPAA